MIRAASQPLLERFADVEATRFPLRPGIIESPITLATQSNNHATLNVLLMHGASPNVKDEECMGILHISAGTGDIKTMDILYEAHL